MAEPDAHERNSVGRRVILAARLERWIETELRAIVEALRRADPVVPCGVSDPTCASRPVSRKPA
jgi:hypothetical protein